MILHREPADVVPQRRTHAFHSQRLFRARPLALCLSTAFFSHLTLGTASSSTTLPMPGLPQSAPKTSAHPKSPDAPQTWVVKNCFDHGTDSLRAIVGDANTHSGDTIDLSQLPVLCATKDATVTLTTGEVGISQDSLTLLGPDPITGSVTISGGGSLRVLDHQGLGTFSLESLTIADGYYHIAGPAHGGCVISQGTVYLLDTNVTNCKVSSTSAEAKGGGIYAHDAIVLNFSTISNNRSNVTASNNNLGGGVASRGTLTAKYSSISDNVAGGSYFSFGGGAYALEGMSILATTIDDNHSSLYSALLTIEGSTNISNSTISNNIATGGGYSVRSDGDSLTISNSTIAFNHAFQDWCGTGVSLQGQSPNNILSLQSSIVANNTAGPNNTPSDVCVLQTSGTLTGSDNLVMASNVSPPGVITVTADPKLGPLQFNGGTTRTRQLSSDSPALTVGNTKGLPPSIAYDQRGVGYPRWTAPNQTIDIGAVQFDTIFAGSFDAQ